MPDRFLKKKKKENNQKFPRKNDAKVSKNSAQKNLQANV